MLLQKFCSRFETWRVKLHNEAFQNSGIEIFDRENIPFAGRTGQDFAQGLVKLLVLRCKRLELFKTNNIHIYELGAGNGILAKRVLDILKKDHQALYKRMILHLTDSSEIMVSQLKKMEIFKKYKGHVVLEEMDAAKIKFRNKPLLVYFTNLIDCLPCRHIRIQDGKVFEIRIQTTVKEDVQIIDTHHYPPKVLNKKEIFALFSPKERKKRLLLTHQLINALEEKTLLVPIEKVKDMSEDEKQDLYKLAHSKNLGDFIFNYSYQARVLIKNLIKSLTKGGFIIISDFGTTKLTQTNASLWSKYQLAIFFAVDFLSLVESAKDLGLSYQLTSKEPSLPQEILLDSLDDNNFKGLFAKEFNQDVQSIINSFLKKAEDILFNPKVSSKSREINQLYRKLPKAAQTDYRLLNDLAFFLLQAKFYNHAIRFTNIINKVYGYTRGTYYFLIRGKAKQEQGRLKEAEAIFKECILLTGNPLAYAYLGNLYLSVNDYKNYLRAGKNYLKYTRNNDQLATYSQIEEAKKRVEF